MTYYLCYSEQPEGFPESGTMSIIDPKATIPVVCHSYPYLTLQTLPSRYPDVKFWMEERITPLTVYYFDMLGREIEINIYGNEKMEALLDRIAERLETTLSESEYSDVWEKSIYSIDAAIFEAYMIYWFLIGESERDATLWVTERAYKVLTKCHFKRLTIRGQFGWYMAIKRIIHPCLHELREYYHAHKNEFIKQ